MLRLFVEIASTTGLVAPLHSRFLTAPRITARLSSDALSRIQGPRAEPIRHVHAERDFGIGYGNSSGYGVDHHYVNEWNPPLFRFI